MGIDYGTKRVGIALTDEDGAMAFPHATYGNDDSLIARVGELCKDKGVGGIVVGKSHDLDGAPNKVQKDIDAFVAALREALSVPVYLEPEQFSTQAALRIQGRTSATDASAAALILDSYITRNQQTL
ncbi:Holliday junction resolvase RuvX [Candidatus Kaiserbacteria bacterium]|nr:Holliday junction resolvase RuvX [Candidatus Kaiserbacteria bacterium]